MFGLFKRKAKGGGGWQKIGREDLLPVKGGQRFDLRFSNGDEIYNLICGRPTVGRTADNVRFEYNGGCNPFHAWKGEKVRGWQIAIRIHEQPFDQAARDARMSRFNDLRKQAVKTGKVTVPSAPEKERA